MLAMFRAVFLNPDRVESWADNNSGWVNAKAQLKLNRLKTHIKRSETREPAIQWTDQTPVSI